jgi:chemotaxis protein histidine kinase CheA
VCSTTYPSLLPIYLAEARERVSALADAADMLLDAPTDRHAWVLVRRSAHGLAGNSAMMGFNAIAETAKALERRAAELSDAANADTDDVLLVDRGSQALRSLIECVARSQENGS